MKKSSSHALFDPNQSSTMSRSSSSKSVKSLNSATTDELPSRFGLIRLKLKDNSRVRSYSTNSNLPDMKSGFLSSNGDVTESSLGKRIKGSHLKDRHSTKISLIQDLANDVEQFNGVFPPDSTFKRSDSLNSFTNQDDVVGSTVWVLRFSHDGLYLAAGRQDGTVIVWEYCDPYYDLKRYSSHSSNTASETQAANAAKPNTANYSSTLHPQSPPPLPPRKLIFFRKPHRIYKGHSLAISDLSWSSGNFFVSASLDGTVRLWHVSHDTCLCVFQHSDFVSAIRFHPYDDNIFASGSFDGRIRVWDIRQKKLLYWNEIQKDVVTAICFTRDASTIIVGTMSGVCVFYDYAGLKYNTQIQISTSKGSKAREAKITGIERIPHASAQEEKVLITSSDSRIRLVSVKDKSLYRNYKGAELKNGRCFASFSKDGEYVISGSDDRHVVVWDSSPKDANQQYSGVLSSVIHRHIDTAKASGQERFLVSDYPITCAMFVPNLASSPRGATPTPNSGSETSSLSKFSIVVGNSRGNILVYILS